MLIANVQGLAFVAEFGKRQPGLLLNKVTDVDDKNYSSALFVKPVLPLIGR